MSSTQPRAVSSWRMSRLVADVHVHLRGRTGAQKCHEPSALVEGEMGRPETHRSQGCAVGHRRKAPNDASQIVRAELYRVLGGAALKGVMKRVGLGRHSDGM